MIQKFHCECGQKISVDIEESAGKKGKCPRCGAVFQIEVEPDTVPLETEEPEPPRRLVPAALWIAAGGIGAGAVAVTLLVVLLGREGPPEARPPEPPAGAEPVVEATPPPRTEGGEGLDRNDPAVAGALAKYEQVERRIEKGALEDRQAHVDEIEGLLAAIADEAARDRLAGRFADLLRLEAREREEGR